MASGGALLAVSVCEVAQIQLLYSLVIWEWIPTHPILKNRGWVRVFCHGTEVKHPVVLPVSGIQEFLRIFAFVSVKSFHAGRRVAHHDHTIRNVDEIWDVNSSEVPITLRVEWCWESV